MLFNLLAFFGKILNFVIDIIKDPPFESAAQ